MTSAMIHLGDRLGLYRGAGRRRRPAHGRRTGRPHRARRAMGARMGLQPGRGQGRRGGGARRGANGSRCHRRPWRCWPTPETRRSALACSTTFRRRWRALERLPESFRTGLGYDYDAHGPEAAVGMERSFEPWNRAHLVPTVLPELEGVHAKLEAGAQVVEIGCGAGGAVLMLGEAFPASQITGYDISRHALERATTRQREAALDNVAFRDPAGAPVAGRSLHRLRGDVRLLPRHDGSAGDDDVIRGAIADDGTWLLVDIKARDTFEENADAQPDGAVDVRDQRALVPVVGALGVWWRWTRHARAVGQPGRGDGSRRWVHEVPPAARRPRHQRVLRSPAVAAGPETVRGDPRP